MWCYPKAFLCPSVNIHPSIYYLEPLIPCRGGWSRSQLTLGERRGTPWTGRQTITGPFSHMNSGQCLENWFRTLSRVALSHIAQNRRLYVSFGSGNTPFGLGEGYSLALPDLPPQHCGGGSGLCCENVNSNI